MVKEGTMHPTVESLRVASVKGEPLVYLCPNKKHSFAQQKATLAALINQYSGQLLMLIDGVRGKEVTETLASLNVELAPLFPEDADPEILDVSPIAAQVTGEDVAATFDLFWGLGIVSLACTSRSEAQEHIARQLYIEDADGEVCLLRLQDPRALVRLADTLSIEQTQKLMGDVITCFLFEDGNGKVLTWDNPTVSEP